MHPFPFHSVGPFSVLSSVPFEGSRAFAFRLFVSWISGAMSEHSFRESVQKDDSLTGMKSVLLSEE